MKESFELDDQDPFDEDIDLDSVDDENSADDNDSSDKEPVVPVVEASGTNNTEEVAQLKRELAESKADRDRIAKEREEIEEEVEKARSTAIQAAINNMQNELARENKDIIKLHQQLENARRDGADTDAIIQAIADKTTSINQLNNNIGNANYQLGQRPVKEKKEVPVLQKTEAEVYGEKVRSLMTEWVKDNSWWDDPAQKEKRNAVDLAYRQAHKDGYNLTTMKFWNFINKTADDFDKKSTEKRRTPPPVRPLGSNNTSTGKAVSNGKIDQAALAEARKFMAMYDKTPESLGETRYKSTLKRAYIAELNRLKQDAANA